jgi:hypothetical protein
MSEVGIMKLLNSYRIDQRANAKKTLSKIEEANSKVLVTHYSCESFYDKPGYTPRVTSIAVLNRENNESMMFSIHISSQILGKDPLHLSNSELDSVEKAMLKEFNNYVKDHVNYVWIHWNMRSASYGFQAIFNRYRILGGSLTTIPDSNKIDLSETFGKLFTYSFEADKPNGKLLNLAVRNKISTRDALPGKDEAQAFDDKDYLKLHMSTMRKVVIISRLYEEYKKGTLKINARNKEIYGLTLPGIIVLVKESRILLLIWTIITFIIGTVVSEIISIIINNNV